MSKGPWTNATRDLHAWEKELKQKRVRDIVQAKKDGYLSRVEAAHLLHKRAVQLAAGPASEWVKFTLKIEKRRLE